jgi:RNA polymerase sigma-70 factor (ECF subfamily)
MFKRLPIETIIGLQNGDEASFNEMYDRYRDLLYVIIHSITRHAETSQDILQDTFVRAFRDIGALKNPLAFHSWIISTAKNLALNAKTKMRETTLDEETWSLIGTEEKPSDFISLWHSYLGREENLVVAYRIVYELTFAEIAKLMEIPLPSAYQIYRRALAILREHYKKEGI